MAGILKLDASFHYLCCFLFYLFFFPEAYKCRGMIVNEIRDQSSLILIRELQIPHPNGVAVTSIEEGIKAAAEISYPVLVRPSFVLGGRAMEIVANEEMLAKYLKNAVEVDKDRPVLVDKYIVGKEVEVDAVCDGTDVFLPGIMELVERTGVHSGDSTSVYPPFSLSEKVRSLIWEYTEKLGRGIGIVGLKEQGLAGTILPEKESWYVKAPAFSFEKLNGMDAYLSPEMKSTGEAIGYDKSLKRALYKALQASGIKMKEYGTVMVTLADEDKEEALPLVKRFYELGFNIEATVGTGNFLKAHGIRTRIRGKLSDGSDEILKSIRAGYVSYIINTRAILSGVHYQDGVEIRRCAIANGVTMFTSLDTVRILLDVLEDISPRIGTI